MLAILRHLTRYHPDLPTLTNDEVVVFLLNNPAVLDSLIKNHKLLGIQYSAHCAQLSDDLTAGKNAEEQIQAALRLSTLLLHIYARYLDETDSIRLMRRHSAIYHRLLKDRGHHIGDEASHIEDTRSFSKLIHDEFSKGNRYRLAAVRVRRFLIVTVPILQKFDMATYCNWVEWMDKLTGPAVSYLAWLVLSPRLMKNILIIAKHTIPNYWMSADEAQLKPMTRFVAQLKLHWFELANDIAVVSIGLLNCFVITSSVSIYLAFSLFVFDVVLAAVQAYIELRYLKRLEAEYQDIQDVTPIDKAYLQYLKKHINYEDERLKIQVKNTLALLVAATCSLPVIAISPVMPLIGAGIAVLTTILHPIAIKRISQEKPDDKVCYRFFTSQSAEAAIQAPADRLSHSV